MNTVGNFYKVSFEQFRKDYLSLFISKEEEILQAYNAVKLPTRATSGSAGYDFVSPIDFTLNLGESITIPTGIRVRIGTKDAWFLGMFPKSGLGFKYRAQLDNTVGIIDSDYYYSDNQGHIMIKITNDSKASSQLKVNSGKSFVQGIFIPFGITYDDNAYGVRNGGFGSTDS